MKQIWLKYIQILGNDRYLRETMSGTNEEETNKNYSKNIVKETVIDKAM